MKKVFSLLLVVSVMLMLIVPVSAVGGESENANVVLSELSEQECIAFLKSRAVEIPDDYEDELVWGPFAKRTIELLEENPSYTFNYNYNTTQSFAEAIKVAVNEYYGISETLAMEESGQSETNSAKTALMDSEVIGVWQDAFLIYNCYGYSIDYFNLINPGFTQTDVEFSISLPIGQMANLTVTDLQNLGHTNVTASTTMPDMDNLCTNERVICIRKGTEDFHYMRFVSSEWRHKPGNTQILRYKYVPSYVRVWTNELVFENVVYGATTRYDSLIYFISFDAEHIYTYKHQYSSTTGDTHTRCCATCGDEFGLAIKCTYATGSSVCKICGTPKTSVADSVPGEPSVTAYSKTLTAAQ